MHGLHINGVLRFGFDFFAYTADVDVHAARCDGAIVAPDAIQQMIPREHHARMRGQIVQQSKFQSAEFDVTSGNADSVRGWIDVYVAMLQRDCVEAPDPAAAAKRAHERSASRMLKGFVT